MSIVSEQDPRGAFNAHWFQLFNAIAFQVMMGAPIIVYAKTLGASSTVLGIIASFTPLMTVFQLPAAKHIDTYGYRRFVLRGWGARTVFIFIMAVVPVMFFLDSMTKLALLLATLFCFNTLRGISSAAWMPWMTALISKERRGRFLSVDQFFLYAGSLFALLASAIVMTGDVEPMEYSLVFLIGAVAGTLSLSFIKRVPDVPPSDSTRRSSQKVPWRAMLRYEPFRRLIVFNLIFMAVIGSMGVFTIEFLRETSHLDVSVVIYLSAFSFVGAMLVLPFVGRIVDSTGSKPLMRVATGLFAIIIFVWCLIAGGILPCDYWLVALLNGLSGMAAANFNLANSRISMATMPEMGRNHFFALFAVITSLGLGAAPVAWGVTLDGIGTYEAVTGAFHWKRHSIYFMALFVINLVSYFFIHRLHESPGSGPMEPTLIYNKLKRSSDNL